MTELETKEYREDMKSDIKMIALIAIFCGGFLLGRWL